MPTVGNKKYSYTKEGMASARKAAQKKGMKISYGKKKK